MRTNSKQRDYNLCQWTLQGLAVAIGKSAAVTVLLAYFFYRSIWAVFPLSAVGILYFKMEREGMTKRCREKLNIQFKDCILAVAGALRAGYAVENAFVESRSDMKMLYGEKSFIYEELEIIRRGLVINIPLEILLEDFAKRSGSDDIRQFSQVFSIAKKSGGNLSEIIQNTASMIGRRIDAKQEIAAQLSGRRMEQRVMKGMPFGILFYIGSTYSGYFDMLYHNFQGMAIMTGCLVLYLAAYISGDKILQKIELEMG